MDPEPWWTYRAQTDQYSDHEHGVVDGDTLDLLLDQGLGTYGAVRVRLGRVDTAETYGVARDTPEYEAGAEQSAFVAGWLAEADEGWAGPWPLIARTTQDGTGKYGRLMAEITRRHDGANLAADLIAEFPGVATE